MLEAVAFLADALPGRHAHVVEHDLAGLVVDHQVVGGGDLDARRVHVDQEAGDAAAGALLRIGDREHLREIDLVGAGDEALDAVDDVVVAVAHGGGAHGGGIGAGVGLGLREAAGLLAADDRHQVFVAGAAFERVEDRADRKAEDAEIARRQRGGAGDLAPDDDLRHHAEAEPAEFLRHVVVPQPELVDLRPQPLRQVLLQLDVVDDLAFERDQLLVDEFAQVVLQEPQFFGQFKVHCSPRWRCQ